MPLWMPGWVPVIGAIVAVVGLLLTAYKSGQVTERERNGYVKRVDCQSTVIRIETALKDGTVQRRELHEKINGVAQDTAEIKGILKSRNNHD